MVIINKFIYKRRDYFRATNGYYKYIYIYIYKRCDYIRATNGYYKYICIKDATISEQPMVIINIYI